MENVLYYAELSADTVIDYIRDAVSVGNIKVSRLKDLEVEAIERIIEDGEYYIKEAAGHYKRTIKSKSNYTFNDFDYNDIALVKLYDLPALFRLINR